jgi:hypothetical protein
MAAANRLLAMEQGDPRRMRADCPEPKDGGEYRQARAQMLVLAARGLSNRQTALNLGANEHVVGRVRKEYRQRGLAVCVKGTPARISWPFWTWWSKSIRNNGSLSSSTTSTPTPNEAARKWLETHQLVSFHYTPTHASWVNLIVCYVLMIRCTTGDDINKGVSM